MFDPGAPVTLRKTMFRHEWREDAFYKKRRELAVFTAGLPGGWDGGDCGHLRKGRDPQRAPPESVPPPGGGLWMAIRLHWFSHQEGQLTSLAWGWTVEYGRPDSPSFRAGP